MTEVRKQAHQPTTGEAVEVVTITVTDLEIQRQETIYGQPVTMSGTVPVVTVEHIAKPGVDEAKVAERLEAKVRKYPNDPGRWTL